MIKSKRFWLNVVTSITMLGALTSTIQLNASEAKYIGIAVALSNIILQVWFSKK